MATNPYLIFFSIFFMEFWVFNVGIRVQCPNAYARRDSSEDVHFYRDWIVNGAGTIDRNDWYCAIAPLRIEIDPICNKVYEIVAVKVPFRKPRVINDCFSDNCYDNVYFYHWSLCLQMGHYNFTLRWDCPRG